MINDLNIFEDSISLTFEEILMEYRISYDFTGNIIEFHPIFSDLPKSAQKLIYGNDAEEILNKMYNYGNLIQIILPLGINYQSSFYSKELESVYCKINDELKSLNIKVEDLHTLSEPMSLRFIIHILHSDLTQDLENIEAHKKYISYIKNIFVKLKIKESPDISILGHINPIFGFKLIPLFIPVLNDPSKRLNAYASLSRNKEKDCSDYLYHQLYKTENPKDIRGILSALSEQEFLEEEIKEKLISIYKSDIELEEYGQKYLVKLLGRFPSKETTDIALEFAIKNLRSPAEESISVLYNNAYPISNILKIIQDKLSTADIKAHKVAYYQMGYVEMIYDHCPDCAELIDQFKKSLELGTNNDVSYIISKIISYKYRKIIFGKKKIINQLVANLECDNLYIVEGFLCLISSLVNDKKIKFKVFSTNKLKLIFYNFLNNEKYSIQRTAYSILTQIGIKSKDKKILMSFIKALNMEFPTNKLLLILESTLSILSTLRYDEGFTPTLIKYTEHEESSIKAKAIEVIAHSNNIEIKKQFLYLKDHPDYQVKNAIKKLEESIEITNSLR